MTDQHPITPPPELVEEWANAAAHEFDIAKFAARWGADQELEACCEWLDKRFRTDPFFAKCLRTARRPKPPSLKEQALEAMSRCDSEMWCEEMEFDLAIIRTALESLPS